MRLCTAFVNPIMLIQRHISLIYRIKPPLVIRKVTKNEKKEIRQKENNNNDDQYLSAIKLNSDDKDSLDSVPKSPPPPIPFQVVWVSEPSSTQGSLTNEHIYESIDDNLYSSKN